MLHKDKSEVIVRRSGWRKTSSWQNETDLRKH